MRVIVIIGMFLLLPAVLAAETIYVIATPIRADRTEVAEESTAFAQSIDTTALADRPVTTEQVLGQAVGAHVRSMGGLGAYSSLTLRGASANQCLVLIDGQRLNAPSGGGVDLSKIPLAEVERIDIIRGSDSALFGESAMGGIVNIVTRHPTDRFRAGLAVTSGSFGAREVRGSLSTPLGDMLGAALTLSRRRAENDYRFENNNGTENDPTDDFTDRRRNNAFDETAYQARLSARAQGWKIGLTATGADSSKEMPGIVTFPTPLADQDVRLRTYTLAAQGQAGKLAVGMDLGRVDQEDTYRDPEAPLYADTRTTTDQGTLGLTYPLGMLRIEPRFSYLREAMDDNLVGDRTRNTRTGSLTLGLTQGPCELIATGRYDRSSPFGGQWTYRAGASWFWTDWLQLKANAGTGYRVPSFYELYYDHGFIVGNQTLTPEHSFSWDIGPVFERQSYGMTLNYFQHRYEDLIVYVLQSGLYYRPYNLSRSVAQGIELYAWFAPWEWLKVSGNYTYNRALDASGQPNQDGNQIPGQPRNIANLQVDLQREFKGVKLGVYAAYNYTEGNFITWANTKKLDDRRIVNCGLTAAPSKRLSLNGEVKNILDKQVMDLRGFPLEGRAYYFTARMSF